MDKGFSIKYTILVMCFFLFACVSHQPEKKNNQNKVQSYSKEDMIETHKYLLKKDSERISNFIKRHDWDMEVTETGLWYMIYQHGEGKQAKKGMDATINYTISLMDGTICYTSDSLGAKTFEIGHNREVSGMDEAIMKMQIGDKAKFIMPPHLAHGLVGDRKKIPARATIIYDIELINLN